MSTTALYNGERVGEETWVHARGLHYGDGVFRTIRIHRGRCLDWSGQRAKLAADAAHLALHPDAPHWEALEREAGALAFERGEGTLKILLWRRGERRGYAPEGTAVERLLLSGPMPVCADECWSRGIVVIDSAIRLATPHVLAGIKHLNRLEQVLASRDWPEGTHEALMQDAEGHVICGTRSNVFWVSGGRLRTPRIDRCGVAGVMRARVLDLATSMGLASEELPAAPRALLDEAEELFVTNSLIGIWPVRRLGERDFHPAPGPVTQELMKALQHPRMG